MSKGVTLNSSGLVGLRGRMCFSVWVGGWKVQINCTVQPKRADVSVEEESSGLTTV